MSRRAGFTLIEMTIVIAILATLAGMAMPMLSMASRMAKRTASVAVMNKVGVALALFRAEIGSQPFQSAYADPDAGEIPGNELYRRLGRPLAVSDLQDLHADADAAAAVYAYDCTNPADPAGSPVEQPAAGVHAFRSSDVKPASGAFQAGGGSVWSFDAATSTWAPNWPKGGWFNNVATLKLATAVMLNRMAAERARLAVFAGNPWVRGCLITSNIKPDGTVFQPVRDNSGQALIATPRSAARPGWCGDYLAGELERSMVAGDAILDAWHRPLVYVCQVVEGVRRPSNGTVFRVPSMQIDARAYGLATLGRTETTAAASDRRTTAPPASAYGCELWSPGPDNRFAWMRHDAANRDNIAVQRHDFGLDR